MSLFYVNSRSKPRPTHADLPVDLDAALAAIANFESDHKVAAVGNISVAKAQHLMRECGKVEPMLIAAIKDGTVKTKAEAVQFVKDNTTDPFPAAKFVNLMQDHLDRVEMQQQGVDDEGNPIMVPVVIHATWAETIAAAKAEEV